MRSWQSWISITCLALGVGILAPVVNGEVTQGGGVRVSVSGTIVPKRLPRDSPVPIAVSMAGKITSLQSAQTPQLRSLAIAINREGHLSTHGIRPCPLAEIEPSTSRDALAACRRSLVGRGTFSADIKLPEQSPFPSDGEVLAFFGAYRGHPAVLAHIYGTAPLPTSYVLPFVIRRSRGGFGTVLEASLPASTGEWGFVTGLSISLSKRFRFHGRRRSFLTAACPAPSGFREVTFPLLRSTFRFAGGRTLSATVIRVCHVRS